MVRYKSLLVLPITSVYTDGYYYAGKAIRQRLFLTLADKVIVFILLFKNIKLWLKNDAVLL